MWSHEQLQKWMETRETEVVKENEKHIDDVMSKLWYELQRIDWRAGRIYKAKDNPSDTLSIYGWMSGVPNNREINQSEIIWALFDQNSWIRNPEATAQINTILGTHIPEKFSRFDIENFTQLTPYIKNYRAIPYKEYEDVKDTLAYLIGEKTGINIDSEFTLDWNITQVWNGLILMIDGKWIDRNDKNFGKVKSINVNFTKDTVEIM